ncbi:hypothetical protein PR048_029022 [Dryococelus australis]|uniref:Uncharacterized protein n=1 Tax=Dryococelus australis TaxID=614101 RepID=A0ABQ9GEQ6_9NEOP|nr:hypothetical protein PR048_029022 [Dryococelus australis]
MKHRDGFVHRIANVGMECQTTFQDDTEIFHLRDHPDHSAPAYRDIVLECAVIIFWNVLMYARVYYGNVLQCTGMCCSVLECAAVYRNVLQCTVVCWSTLDCTGVYCNVMGCARVVYVLGVALNGIQRPGDLAIAQAQLNTTLKLKLQHLWAERNKISATSVPRWCSGQTTRLPPRRTGFNFPGGVVPRFSHVGIVPDDADGRRVFSGISRFSSSPIITSFKPHRLSRPPSTLEPSPQHPLRRQRGRRMLSFFVRCPSYKEKDKNVRQRHWCERRVWGTDLGGRPSPRQAGPAYAPRLQPALCRGRRRRRRLLLSPAGQDLPAGAAAAALRLRRRRRPRGPAPVPPPPPAQHTTDLQIPVSHESSVLGTSGWRGSRGWLFSSTAKATVLVLPTPLRLSSDEYLLPSSLYGTSFARDCFVCRSKDEQLRLSSTTWSAPTSSDKYLPLTWRSADVRLLGSGGIGGAFSSALRDLLRSLLLLVFALLPDGCCCFCLFSKNARPLSIRDAFFSSDEAWAGCWTRIFHGSSQILSKALCLVFSFWRSLLSLWVSTATGVAGGSSRTLVAAPLICGGGKAVWGVGLSRTAPASPQSIAIFGCGSASRANWMLTRGRLPPDRLRGSDLRGNPPTP